MTTTKRTNEPTTDLYHLPRGTMVVSTLDGESGTILKVASQNRPRTKASAYVVQTTDGREIWDVQDLFIPDNA
ncbi:MAG: hypothetical protein HZA51_09040 [Planctomycetes bacterium]|nr:hypothetical protein [Planctomycetota bacterium]